MSSAIPIRNGGDQSIPVQFHRDSFAHSQGIGGISWGGASVGSWLRDEVLMATKDNKEVANNFGSLMAGSAVSDSMGPAVGTPGDAALGSMAMSPDQPSYFPSIEANFCKDYSCCGNILPTLHDLLRHYEENHISPSPPNEPPVMRRIQNIETVSTNDVFLPFDTGHANDSLGGSSHAPQHAAFSGSNISSRSTGHNSRSNGAGAGGGADDIDMDLGAAGLGNSSLGGLGVGNVQQQAFAPPSFQPVNQGLAHMNALANPEAMLNRQQPARARGANGTASAAGLNSAVMNNFGNSTVGTAAAPLALGDDDEPTIDDPARQLYMLERSENKPFKCPVIGCEKTYKNQNGLKYHRQHGHQNQTLHLNDDGTYSIIDPLSNTPYPDGMGMEKDKPYRCEICGKRYKNLNGLKYHRAHSTH